MEFTNKYLQHLGENPERIDALLIWTVCTIFCWFWLIRYRERMIAGLEGENKFWEAGEQFTWLMMLITPPVIFYFLCFTPNERIYVLIAIVAIVAFNIGGRWLLTYGLVASGKASIDDLKKEEKEESKQPNNAESK